MLSKTVFIFTPASIGSGQYTASIFFSASQGVAKYAAIGDYLEDTAGNRYEVIAPTAQPFSDGGTMTVQFVDNDVLPVADSGFDSLFYTPGQVDKRPLMRTPGTLTTSADFDTPNYEYTLEANWDSPSQANIAVVGDRFIDPSGKEYEITFIDGVSKFGVPFRAKEVEKIGQSPALGGSTMYRPTTNFNFFQGNELTDPARTNIFNRDSFVTDVELQNALSAGGGTSLTKSMVNNSGAQIAASTPVCIKSDGSIALTDSDVAAQRQYIGVTVAAIDDGQAGNVYIVGQNLAGVLTGGGFTSGQFIYMGEAPGTFVGSPGDFTNMDDRITKVGVAAPPAGVAQASATDLIMFTQVVGEF